jgi:Na+:H+ antiporter, NhaA family
MTPHHQTDERGTIRSPFLAERAAATLEKYLHIEALSGIVLLVAAIVALAWANSSFADTYAALWHAPLALQIGSWRYSQTVHFWINDGLMTIFFLVVGMEIRREIHEGALSTLQQAALPLAAALGGVVVPALIYLAINSTPPGRSGWAVPTATDIAFAVGMLALLGKRIPSGIRVILLALAVIDDLIAVLVIALFYTGGLSTSGFVVAGIGILLVFGFQRAGIGSGWAYLLPGAIVWIGFLMTGAHPTLAGVVLGLLTPVRSFWRRDPPERVLSRIASELAQRDIDPIRDAHHLSEPLRQMGLATREILPPAVRVQMALHPWVAYGVMPIFALANAGVSIDPTALAMGDAFKVAVGVTLALAIGKPLGVVVTSWCAVRAGLCRLPEGVTWQGIVLLGLLTGIGFTMSIFIAMLAFEDPAMVTAAKLGVLLGSLSAAMAGLAWGALYRRKNFPREVRS